MRDDVFSGEALDHDDFGLNQSKVTNAIDSNRLERDASGKPLHTFPHPALTFSTAQNAGPASRTKRRPCFGRTPVALTLMFAIFAALPVAAEPRTIADCEKIQAADAYNQCLASFGPVAHKHGVSADPEGGGNGGGGGGASTAAHAARRGHGAHAAHASPHGSHGRGRHYHASRPGRHATGHYAARHQYGHQSSKHMSSKHQASGHRAAPTHAGRHHMEFKVKR